MKKTMILILMACLVFTLPAFAEEETEAETEESFEKGSRMDPYELGEEAHLGMVYEVYDEGCEYADVTITLEEVLDQEALEELYPDDSISNGKYVAVKGTLSTGSASSDDEEVYLYLNIDGYSSSLDEIHADIYTYSDVKSFRDAFSYCDYDIIIRCDYEEDSDLQYIRFGFYPTEESYDYINGIYDESFVWFKLS